MICSETPNSNEPGSSFFLGSSGPSQYSGFNGSFKTRVTPKEFTETLTLLLCECLATGGKVLGFTVDLKIEETEEGAKILTWEVKSKKVSDKIRVILDESSKMCPYCVQRREIEHYASVLKSACLAQDISCHSRSCRVSYRLREEVVA